MCIRYKLVSFRCTPTFDDLSFIVAFDEGGLVPRITIRAGTDIRSTRCSNREFADRLIVENTKRWKHAGGSTRSVKTLKLGHLIILYYLGCWTTKRYEFTSLEKVERNNYI